jgi:hypothetical protein
MIKNLKENKSGNANIILLAIMTVIMGFGMLTIGTYIYYAIASSADAGQITLDPARASTGIITFSGNTTNNSFINVTAGSAIYRFEFNASGTPPICGTANCITVWVGNNNNGSVKSSGNLTNAWNNNASLALLATAVNTTNTTTLTTVTSGTAANSVFTLQSVLATVSLTQLYGGFDAVTGQSSQTGLNNYVNVVFPLFGLALMILGFSVILVTLRKSFGGGEAR